MSVMSRLHDGGYETYTRSQWGSVREREGAYERRRRTHPMPSGPAAYHYLHISVTRDTDTVKEGAAGARQIEAYGYTTPPMVSYQLLVTNEGKIFEGQNYGVKGTHTVNDKRVSGFPSDLNYYGYAVALMQNVEDEVTDVQVRAIAAAFAAAELEGWVRKGAPIYPHRKFAPKSCPGDKAVARLGEIQNLKDQMVREGTINQEEDMALSQDDKDWLKTQIEKAVRDNKVDVGKKFKWADDTVAETLINRAARAEALSLQTLEAVNRVAAALDDLKAVLK